MYASDIRSIIIIISPRGSTIHAYAGQLNRITHLRALVVVGYKELGLRVVHERGSVNHFVLFYSIHASDISNDNNTSPL
jgi:hypothetical protein